MISDLLKAIRTLLSSDRRQLSRRGIQRPASAFRTERLEDRTLLAVNLIKDINIAAATASSNPSGIVDVGGVTFFAASVEGYGTELWKSDGTAEGTVLVRDIRAGSGSSGPSYLTNVNGTLFFSASDGVNGVELWKSDGTAAGTVLVKDISAGSGSSRPRSLTNVNGTLFFSASDGSNAYELWKSDGTAAGSVLVKDINSGSASSAPTLLTNVNGTLYFRATDNVNGAELWKSDGTVAGTVLLKDILPGNSTSGLSNLTSVNGTAFFIANDGVNGYELWKSDGTAAGTALVKDILLGSGGSSPTIPNALVNVNGTLYFRANDGLSGAELWKSDGTAAGTVLVKDILSGSSNSNPVYLTNVNGTLYFTANDGVAGGELWKSDGTAAGTVLVKDIRSGSNGSNPVLLTNVNGTLYFKASDELNGAELWKSDGTAADTVFVKDILSGSGSSSPKILTNVNGTLYFRANDGVNGDELWKSDGTAAGTMMVKDIFPVASSSPNTLMNANGTLYFLANDGVTGDELWKSDGTVAGTVLVKDIRPGSNNSSPRYLTYVNGTLYFSANDDETGDELWKSDGTAAGTVRVKDIVSGGSGSGPSNLTNVNGTLYFRAHNGVNGVELWKSDGTAAGTVLVKDIHPSNSSTPRYLVNVNGTLYFSANDGVNGIELWKSDGTAAGTVQVKDVNSGSSASLPNLLTNVNGTLYFIASESVNGEELWKSDGTTAGTVLVKNIHPSSNSTPRYLTNVNGTLYFRATDGVNGVELWKSDGTAAGTVQVKDIFSGSSSSSPNVLTNINGTLYFRANDGVNGEELWKSDGTVEGTVLVKDIRAGSISSSPSNLTNVNGTLYFLALNGAGFNELWKSDGTTAGTVLASSRFPGSGGSTPSFLTAVGERLFFSAFDPSVGRELWVVEEPPVDAAPPVDIQLTNNSLAENQPSRTFVGTFLTTDPNTGDTFTYSLTTGEGSGDNARFVIDGSMLRTNAILDYESKPSHAVRIRSTDQWGLSFEKTFTINVSDVNESPVSVTLSRTVVEQNQPIGSVVGQLSTTDSDFGNTFTYALVSGIGASGNPQFTLVGDSIRTAEVFIRAVQSSYSIRVRSTDQGGLSIEQIFSISVGVNQAPTGITLANVITSLPENTSTISAIKVGDIVVIDDGMGTNNLFKIVTDVTSSHFEIVGSELRLKAGTVLDYETTQFLSVGIGVNDPAVGSAIDAATSLPIELIDVNEAATLSLENQVLSVLDKTSLPDGIRVANVIVGDDALGTNTRSLSGTDAGAFEIVGSHLRLRAGTVIDRAIKQSYSVSVNMDDASIPGNPDTSSIFTIGVNDRPTVSGKNLATTAGIGVSTILSGTDQYGDPLVYRITQSPRNGTLSGTGADRFYSPNMGFSGIEEFYYVANDGAVDSFEARVQITVQGIKPIVTFITPSSAASENAGRYPVTAFVSEVQPTDLYIPLALSGTAVRDLDYVSNGQIVIPAGKNYGSFVVNVVDDTNYKPTPETVVATILASPFYNLATVNTHTVNINDNDTVPQLSFQTKSINISESAQTINVGLVLSGDSPVPITIFLNYGGTATRVFDYTGFTGVTIPAGSRSVSFPVTIVNDILPEDAETIQISINTSVLQGAVLSTNADAAPQSVITIAANDRPTVSFKTASRTVSESGSSVKVEATLSEPASFERTVSFNVAGTASPLSDFGLLSTLNTGFSNTFYFAAGSTTASRTIRIDNDETPESVETVILTLLPNGWDALGAERKFTLQIIDDDKVTISLQSSNFTVWEDEGVVTVRATLSAPVSQVTLVPFSVSSATPPAPPAPPTPAQQQQQQRQQQQQPSNLPQKRNFFLTESEPIEQVEIKQATITRDFSTQTQLTQLRYGLLRFEPNSTQASVTFNIINDTESDESQEKFVVSLGALPSTITAGANLNTTVLIKDNDPIVSVTADVVSIDELDVSRATFTVSLSAASNTPVVVPLLWSGSARRDTDYTFGSDWISIPAGSVSASTTITVSGDEVVEDDESIVLTLGKPTGVGAEKTGAKASPVENAARVTIVDNDNDRLPKVAFYRSFMFEGNPRDVRVTDADRYLAEQQESVVYKIKTIEATSRETRVRLEIKGSQIADSVGYDFYTISELDSVEVAVEGKLIAGWLTIPAGIGEASFSITSLDNDEYHGDLEFTITISEAENATTSGRTESTRFKIFDDEQVPVPPRYSPSSWDVLNSAGTGSLAIDPRAANGQISGVSGNIGSLSNGTIETITGSLMIGNGKNGLLTSATVFLDSNFNGVQDFLDFNSNGVQEIGEPAELATVTQIDGSFALYISADYDFNGDEILGTNEGRWLLAGGRDTSTGEPYKTNLAAPLGFYSISPLTTLAESLVRTQSYTVRQSLTRINEALGIDSYNFGNGNPLYDILEGDGVAAGADRELNKVSDTVVQLASLFSGLSGGELRIQYIADLLYDELASLIAAEGATLELSLPSMVESIIDRVSFRTGLTLESDLIAGAASIVSATSERIDALNLTDFSNGTDFVVALTKIKNLAQNQAAEALYSVGAGTLPISTAVTEFTGTLLDQKIATTHVGVVVPPVVGVGNTIVRERANGSLVMSFEVALVGEHDYPVSVRYRTVDDSATIADNDYLSATGLLTWAPNDSTSKFVEVVITGDARFEVDEAIRLQIYESIGAAIRIQEGYGFIANDDAFLFTSNPEQLANNLRLISNIEMLELVQNGTTQWSGEFADAVTGAIEGQDSADDVLTLDFPDNSFRDDTFSFTGGTGNGVDTFRALAGTFFTVEHRILLGKSGTTSFWSDSTSAAGRMHWSETELVQLAVSSVDNFTIRILASVSDVIVEDADPTQPGMMRIRSLTGAFAPVEFTNPTNALALIFEDPAATATVVSLDSAFTGVVLQGSLTLGLSSTSVAEGVVVGTTVGSFTTTDGIGSGDTFVYTLVSGAGSVDNDSFRIIGNELKTHAELDFETKNSFSVRVRTTDQNGIFVENELTITVTNVNEVPISLSLSANTIAENNAVAAVVGAFSTIDPDAENTFTYSLVAVPGSSDHFAFTIDGNQLKAAASFDFETKNSYAIRVRSTDQGGLFTERTFTITVTDVVEDVTAPTSLITSVPAASTSLVIPINVAGNDPGAGALGVKEYDLFFSTGGAFVKFATVPSGSPSTSFTGSPNTTYWFRSLAKDNAGNVETKTSSDTYTRIGDVVPPTTQVTTAVPNSSGVFAVSMTGTKASGSVLTQFDVYVSVDNSAAVLIGTATGGTPVAGVYSGSVAFQGLADGTSHTYRFYSVGRDGSGNLEAAPVAGDVSAMYSFSAVAFSASGIDVQSGANQRSYVRYLDVLFSNAAELAAWPAVGRVAVERVRSGYGA